MCNLCLIRLLIFALAPRGEFDAGAGDKWRVGKPKIVWFTCSVRGDEGR